MLNVIQLRIYRCYNSRVGVVSTVPEVYFVHKRLICTVNSPLKTIAILAL